MTRTLLEGSRHGPWRRIGEVELVAERTFHVDTYACAAWWRDVTCAPQTVAMTSNGYWVCFSFAGTVTAAYLPAMFAGAAIGAPDESRDVSRAGIQDVPALQL